MDRRTFFGSIAALAVGAALPDRRLPYEPPALTYLGVDPGVRDSTAVAMVSMMNPRVIAVIQEATLRRAFRQTCDYRRLFNITEIAVES